MADDNNNANHDDIAMVSSGDDDDDEDKENASSSPDDNNVAPTHSSTTADATAPAIMEETVRQDDDDDDQQQQQRQQHAQDHSNATTTTTAPTLGGTIDTPCFCLLDGIIDLTSSNNNNNNNNKQDESVADDAASKKRERLLVPITSLPAILGRTHQTADHNFIPLGTFTTLSRQHCKIEYWCSRQTGRLEQQQQSKSKDDDTKLKEEEAAAPEFTFVPQKEKDFKSFKNNKDKAATDNDDKPFYTITCLGKNRIFVNKEKLEKGETAVLSDRAAIRLSNTCFLYFLLPTKFPSTQTREITPPSRPTKKRKTTATTSSFTVTSSGLTATGDKNNNNNNKHKSRTTNTTDSTTTAPKRAGGRGVSHIQAELDKLSNDELRRQLTAAIEDDIWERRHQLIGSTLSGRAILAVAHDPVLRQKCQTESGLSRGEIMDWIATSDEFAVWSQQMLNKLEIKSYQSSITKAMIKAGFTRTASSGRYIKWMLPDMKLNAITGKVQNKSATAEQEADDDDDAQDKTAAAPAQDSSDVDEDDHDKEDEEDKRDETKEEKEQADENQSENENEDDADEQEDNQDEENEEAEQETSKTIEEQGKSESQINEETATSGSGVKQDDEEVVSWSIREP